MTNPAQNNPLDKLLIYTNQARQNLINNHPQLAEVLDSSSNISFSNQNQNDRENNLHPDIVDQDNSSDQPIKKFASYLAEQTTNHDVALTITQEEHQTIIIKLKELSNQPAGQLQTDTALYLEQQLSDILGINLTTNLENQQLPYTTGVMKALTHTPRSPSDSLDQHLRIKEAGLNKNRSFFGWFFSSGSPETPEFETYSISLPLMLLPNWSSDQANLKNWYKYRKFIVINPHNQMAIVARATDIGPQQSLKYQFGGSPELIRDGLIWSPTAQGKVFVFFVDDPTDRVQLGPVDFSVNAFL